jgi:hypothetical protein
LFACFSARWQFQSIIRRYEVEYTDKGEVIVIEAYEKYEDGLLSDAAKVFMPILLIFF